VVLSFPTRLSSDLVLFILKKTIKFLWPVLLLFLALGFMTKFKHLNVSTDMKRYEIQSYVEAAENGEDLKETQQVQREGGDQEESAAGDDEEVDEQYTGLAVDDTESDEEEQEKEQEDSADETDYAITSDESTVTVHDKDGNTVFETSIEDWEEHREEYYKEYHL